MTYITKTGCPILNKWIAKLGKENGFKGAFEYFNDDYDYAVLYENNKELNLYSKMHVKGDEKEVSLEEFLGLIIEKTYSFDELKKYPGCVFESVIAYSQFAVLHDERILWITGRALADYSWKDNKFRKIADKFEIKYEV